MSYQYVMADIQIPIKIYENGSTEPLPEYIKINISECKELPVKVESPAIESDFIQQIRTIISPNKKEESIVDTDIVNMLTISKEEMKNKKHKQHSHNITFKNSSYSHRRSHKKYFTS